MSQCPDLVYWSLLNATLRWILYEKSDFLVFNHMKTKMRSLQAVRHIGVAILTACQAFKKFVAPAINVCKLKGPNSLHILQHVSSAEHQTKSADQDHPLGSLGSSGTPQAKMAGQKTNFNLKYGQTADGVGHWGAKKVPQVKKRPHLLSSFVSAGSNAR